MDSSYLKEQQSLLLARRANKLQILKEGGQQALSHSFSDITRIDYALKRIEQGQYGLCCNCGNHIGFTRLATIPEAPLCIDCASARENN